MVHIDLQNKKLLQLPQIPQGAKSFEVQNPIDNSFVALLPDIEKSVVNKVLEVAQNNLEDWKIKPVKYRSKILYHWYQLIIEHAADLAKIMVTEQGKPYKEAFDEVVYGASFVQWFAEQAKRIQGGIVSGYDENISVQYTKEAVGVVGVITPWNFPIAMITRKVAPALAAGCTVVAKPSELTPLSALALANLAQRAGIPDGVLQMVTSTDAKGIGEALCENKQVRKISFTGSTKVGKLLYAASACSIKRMSLELGGNAAFIIFEDADLDKAAAALLLCKFRNSGQTCVCANRIFVQESILESFLEKFLPLVEGLKLGDGMLADTTQGPLINQGAIQKVEKHIQSAVADGAKILIGGKKHALGDTFFEPTVLLGIKPYSIFWDEETFGPVAPICSFQTEQEVTELANATNSGLANYFFTKDYQIIHRLNQNLLSGIVGINTGIISNEFGPFGGVKESGIGREGSQLGIDEYLETKYTMISYQ